ncbi:glycosyltransferase family 87 protein [Methylobacterium mesophilicum]|uniref:glycosyltransferase family 87 protein n=1 Tax=Methylobacterium mesophilicum TaxID=39956 RepID=UPI002F355323
MASLLGLALTIVGIAAALLTIAKRPGWPVSADLDIYLDAAKLFVQGQSPYILDADRDPFAYPPFLAGLVGLIGQGIGYGKLWIFWPCLSIGLLAGCVLLLRRFGRIMPDGWLLLATGVLLCSRAIRSDLFHGQINILLLFVLLLGLRSFLNRATVRGSAAWAFVIVCKPFMGVLVFYLLFRRGWRAAVMTAGIAAVLFLGPFLMIGSPLAAVRGWVAASTFYTTLPAGARPDHQSLPALAKRLFAENPFSVPWIDAPVLAQAVSVLAAIAAVTVFLAAIAMDRGRAEAADDTTDTGRPLAEVGLTVGLALSCGPLLEGDHLILIWPALYGSVLCAQRAAAKSRIERGRWISAAAAWCAVFWIFTLPVIVPFVVSPTWPVLEGARILLSGRNGIMVLVACLFTASALRASAASRIDALEGHRAPQGSRLQSLGTSSSRI